MRTEISPEWDVVVIGSGFGGSMAAHELVQRGRFPVSVRDRGGYHAMLTDFLSVLRNGGEPRMTLAHARRDLELIEQASGEVLIQ